MNFAALRDRDVELVWAKMGQIEIMKSLEETAYVCNTV